MNSVVRTDRRTAADRNVVSKEPRQICSGSREFGVCVQDYGLKVMSRIKIKIFKSSATELQIKAVNGHTVE